MSDEVLGTGWIWFFCVKLKLLHSTFRDDGTASPCQHLTSMVVDGVVAFDAGSLAMAATTQIRSSVRDVVVSHAHLDHIAGLPLFIDDLFASLTEPVRIHATRAVLDTLEQHIFNWSVYPRFSELENEYGAVMEYSELLPNQASGIRHLTVVPIEVNHKVPSCGFVISDGQATVASTGDTAPTDQFWERVSGLESVSAVLVECAFPDRLDGLAENSHHLTPSGLAAELEKLDRADCRILVSNIKPMYRDETVSELRKLRIDRLEILEVGRTYEF